MMFRTASNPRSILKHQSASYHHATPSPPASDANRPSCAVRFPSSPKISTVHFTHCSSSYDRRPIVVLPNSCELPDRGCRDYTGASTSPHMGQTSLPQAWGNHVHPSVFGRMCANAAGSSEDEEDHERRRRLSSSSLEDHDLAYGWYSGTPPALTHDDASSEESDGVASPPPEQQHAQAGARAAPYFPPSQSHLHSEPLSHPPIPDCYGRTAPADAMSFLPHAHSPTQKKRSSEKKRSSLDAASKRLSATTGSFSWTSTTEEDSCLGGF